MSNKIIDESYLEDIGDAVRGKLGVGTKYKPSQMASAIRSIPASREPVGSISITSNGIKYIKNYETANVNVPNSYEASDEGKVVSNGGLVSQTTKNINANGMVDTTTNNSVVVNVPNSYSASDEGKVVDNGALVAQTSTTKTANGTYDTTTNDEVVIDVPNTYSASDEGKVVDNGALVAQSSQNISQNGTYDTTLKNEVVVNVSGGGGGSTLISKTITQNGTYNAEDDNADGYDEVTVNVSGGSGVELMTQAAWDALTTAQKQAKGLVAIERSSSGFNRGILVNGADYVDVGIYLPYSDKSKIICSAHPDNYDDTLTSWGDGDSPVTLSAIGSVQNADGSVAIKVKTDGTLAYVDLGQAKKPFTVYIVAKVALANGAYTRELGVMAQRRAGNGMMLFGTTISVSSWASDTSTGISSSNYFVGVLQYDGSANGLGSVINLSSATPTFISKTPSTAGQYITIGRTDIDSSAANAEPSDMDVLFLGVTTDVESQTIIAQNMQYLAQQFIDS